MPTEREIGERLLRARQGSSAKFAVMIMTSGLFLHKKWDKITYEEKCSEKKKLSREKIEEISDKTTDHDYDEMIKESRRIIYRLSENKNGFCYGALQSLAGSILFSAILIALYFIAKFGGYDVRDLARTLVSDSVEISEEISKTATRP